MFAKRLLQKVKNSSNNHQHNFRHGNLKSTDIDPGIAVHYGVPSTASILAFDPIQRLLAIGTLDGRIKVIGGDNIEGLLISPKSLPYKFLEFLQNQGFLVSISNANEIEIWDLEHRCIASSLQWDSNITAFCVIRNTSFMYIGDEYGLLSVLKYDVEEGKLSLLPYHVPAVSLTEAIGVLLPYHESIVGVLPQPFTSGNRVLIAYENGLMILWDINEAQAVVVKGNKDLLLDNEAHVNSPSGGSDELLDTTLDNVQEEKEISSLCWASSSGTILAVGYVDGDVMLWNLSSSSSILQGAGVSSNGVVKLQLSSGKRRIPVILLHWAADNQSHNDSKGHLFIYGGDEIGSEEVLTVLSLEWSSGLQMLKCVGRVDLTLGGSFADMILIPKAGSVDSDVNAALFVLTNPGQLHVYSDVNMSSLAPHSKDGSSLSAMKFPVVIPMMDPVLTTAKLSLVTDNESSKTLSEIASLTKNGASANPTAGTEWPLTGGVPSLLSFSKEKRIERIYIAGYHDGSVRIWDATYPVLSLIVVLSDEIDCTKASRDSSPVTALDFWCQSTCLAVGDKSGLVLVYKFYEISEETNVHLVTETKHEVNIMHQRKGLQCTAVFSILSSPVQILQFENSGANLAVGFECGHVAMLDTRTFSVLFLTDCISSSPVVSVVVKTVPDVTNIVKSPKHSGSKNLKQPTGGIMFILTRDSHISVIDSHTGIMILPRLIHSKKESDAISLFVIEHNMLTSEVSNGKETVHLAKDNFVTKESEKMIIDDGDKSGEVELHSSNEAEYSKEKLSDSVVLLCSKTALRLYPLKSIILGDKKSICKVKLEKPCCWSTVIKQKGKDSCGLILLYQTGVIELRSLPDLEVVTESSLMSILRWNFRANMNKLMSSSDNGLIALASGSELAFISFFAGENDFRIPESLPCLQDKVLAAAADAAISFSSNQKKKQGAAPGLLNGIIKGFKGKKVDHTPKFSADFPNFDLASHLETVFHTVPFAESSADIADDQELELSLDEIEIDEPVEVVSASSHLGKSTSKEVVSTSSHLGKSASKDNSSERDRLFEGATTDMKPRLRTHEEIIAKYRKAGDASTAAAQARDKLLQRQEKLERISRRTEELQNGAENFASMANDLVKVMEARKWYHL